MHHGELTWHYYGLCSLSLILFLSFGTGNGTQKAFYADSDVLYISVHRFDGAFYPGGSGGDSDMIGEDAGKGL